MIPIKMNIVSFFVKYIPVDKIIIYEHSLVFIYPLCCVINCVAKTKAKAKDMINEAKARAIQNTLVIIIRSYCKQRILQTQNSPKS